MTEIKALTCPQCHTDLELDADYFDELAGGTISCPECESEIRVPAPADRPAPEKGRRKIILKKKAPREEQGATEQAPSAGAAPRCPRCDGAVAPDAVLCVACGTDLKTGDQVSVATPAQRKSDTRSLRGIGRLLVGAAAIAVTLGVGYRMYARHRDHKKEHHSRIIAQTVMGARAGENYAASVARLEKAIQDHSRWATNLHEANDMLEHLRRELEEVPARTAAVKAAMEAAQRADTLETRIATLLPVLQQNPGSEVRNEAERLITEWRRQLRLRNELNARIQRAQQAASPEEGVRILQDAIPRFGGAPNLSEAYELRDRLRDAMQEE